MDFVVELARWGPNADYATPTLAEAQAYVRYVASTHYENFTVASWILPRRLVPHFHAVYAYCRWADDLGDETGGGERALSLLQWWREELHRAYAGESRHPVMLALRETIRAFAIPPEPFLDLILAFEQDQRVKRYDTFEQLVGYCRWSANPVGRLVLYLCASFDGPRAALSDEVCTGLQLANFWQDVARDFAIGRVYLPREDRDRFGFSDADLERRQTTPAFRELMRFEVARARGFLERGLALPPLLPRDVRVDVELFARGGLAILERIDALDGAVWETRPKLTKLAKAKLLARVLWGKACGVFG